MFLIDAVSHQFRLGALRGGIGQQQRGRTGDFRQAQLINSASEWLERTFLQIGADGHDRVERRHRLGQRSTFATVDVQGDFRALGGQRNVLPLRRSQCLCRSGALAVDFHEWQTLADADQQTLRAFATRQYHLLATRLIQTQPGTEGERAAGVVLQ